MTDKRRVVGVLAVLIVVVSTAVVLWPWSSTRLAEQVGASRVVDSDPGDVELMTSAAGDTPSENLEAPVRREVVESESGSKDEAAGGRALLVRGVVRSTDDQPVAKALVRVGERFRTVAAADGSYELAARLRVDEPLWGIAEADGWVTAAEQVAVDGEEGYADFVLRPAFIVTGRVTGMAGTGIAGAEVVTFRRLHRPATTDAEGYFRLADIDPRGKGLYLEASASGYVARGEMIPFEGEGLDGLVIELSRGAIVRGVVRGPGQEPVEGAALVITTGVSKSQYRMEAESDSEGRFEFSGVPPGRHRLDATHGQFAATRHEIDVLAPGTPLDVVVELSVGRTLRGIVRSAFGGPIAEAKVSAHSGYGKGRGGALRNAGTDEQGLFELKGVPREALRLSCDAEGFVPARGEMVAAGTEYREIILEPSARIAGTVVDAFSGEPIQVFTIRLRGAAGKEVKSGRGRGLRFTNQLGQWDTGDIPLRVGATADVEVLAKGYAPTVMAGLVARVEASYDDYRIALSSGVTLTGTVETDAGMPMAGARLQLVLGGGAAAPASGKGGGNRHRTSRSDTAGRFAFDNVAHGGVRIVVEHSDTGVYVHEARIPKGSSEWHVTVRVAAQGEVRGMVRAADGQAVAEADVVLTAVEVPGLGGRQWRSVTGTDGEFVFRDLPFGVYRVARTESMAGKPLETFARHVAVTTTTPLEVDVRAAGAAMVRGMLIANFAVADDSIVHLIPQYAANVPASERSTSRFTRVRNGSFVFEGVEPGPHLLRAWGHDQSADEWHTGQAETEVAASGETQVDVALTNR